MFCNIHLSITPEVPLNPTVAKELLSSIKIINIISIV